MENGAPFCQVLNQVAQQNNAVALHIPGCGGLSVYPQQQCYAADISDWVAAFQAPFIEVRHCALPLPLSLSLSLPSSNVQPLLELQWRAAHHWVAHKPALQIGIHQLVWLLNWPNLTRLPAELVAPVTQVCALLWRKPAVAYLVPRVLHIEPVKAQLLLELMRSFGHIELSSLAHSTHSDALPVEPDNAASALVASPSPSVIGKLWRRLVGN